jgi:MATE family multidrug resistance protein
MPRFGLPGYGVSGAAWASVLGSVAGFLTLAVPFGKEALAARRAAPLGLKMKEFVRVLRFGVPNGLNWFLEFAAFIIFINAVVGHLGTRVLAAFNVVMQLNSVAFMPAFGLASGGAILVGETIGKGQKGAVWPLVRMTAMVSAVWMLTVGAVYAVIPRYLMGFFEPEGATTTELVDAGTMMLMFAILWQLFDALGMTLSEALRAAGDTTWCMWARIVLAWGLFTPVGWAAVFVFHGGVTTIMMSLVIYMAALSSTLGLRFASGRWKNIELVEEPVV